MDIRTISIEEIGLSMRSLHALRRAEVYTVGDMLRYTEDALMQVRSLGRKSVQEILEKIAEYTQYLESGILPPGFKEPQDNTIIPEAWVLADENREKVLAFFQEKNSDIEELELLSVKAYNLLQINGFEKMHQILFLTKEHLMEIPRMEAQIAEEIVKLCCHFLKEKAEEICAALLQEHPAVLSLTELMQQTEYREIITAYVTANDLELDKTNLPNRAKNQLAKNGYTFMSQILFLSKEQLQEIPAMGAASVNAVLDLVQNYLHKHNDRLIAVCSGDLSVMYGDEYVQHSILQLYSKNAFAGYSLNEMLERLSLPKEIGVDRLKKNIGVLLAAKELEYVDFRCYRIYGRFRDYFESCSELDERRRDCIRKKLNGMTLEAIGREYDLSKERVRQIIDRGIDIVRNHYLMQTGKKVFDEEYYRYLYETYAFDKQDGEKWLGIPAYVWNFLSLIDAKQGKKDLEEALNDQSRLGLGMRLKIKNYCNRDKIFVDGVWVEKKRSALEKVAARRICTESISFGEFCTQYNELLQQEGIPYDPNIYIDDESRHARASRLMDRRFILWTQNETMRYYDMDSRDYSELVDTLHLDVYENIELSTAKFMRDYPDVMEKYDIRDQYELHNLLRKIVPEGSFHGFQCGRMPHIAFGTFDRTGAIWDLIANNAPINLQDLCALIEAEYGYDLAGIPANYLQPFSVYYHQGMYTVDQKEMSEANQTLLKAALTEDFYYIDEIKKLYGQIAPGADIEEINPYNLKNMGFIVLCRYVVQNYPSLEAYCKDILTREEIVDITPYKKRLAYVQMFSQTLTELKRNLTVVEFEPNKLIQFHKLENAGVTRGIIQEYCDCVYNAVADGTYFSIKSLQQDGFAHELFELGFSDWFYASLLLSDDRFAVARIYGMLIFCKNETAITIQSFLVNRIQEHGMIDAYDLMTELISRFGCSVEEKSRIPYRLENTEVYYDRILDRFYVNAEAYYQDLGEGEF